MNRITIPISLGQVQIMSPLLFKFIYVINNVNQTELKEFSIDGINNFYVNTFAKMSSTFRSILVNPLWNVVTYIWFFLMFFLSVGFMTLK